MTGASWYAAQQGFAIVWDNKRSGWTVVKEITKEDRVNKLLKHVDAIPDPKPRPVSSGDK